jgi:hypothetical protein
MAASRSQIDAIKGWRVGSGRMVDLAFFAGQHRM